MNIIQQIVVKGVEEITKKIEETGIGDIGKVIKDLVPAVSEMVLEIVSACIEEADAALVKGTKAQRRKDGIAIKERGVERTLMTELGELHYKRTYFALPEKKYSYLVDHCIGVEAYERISKEYIAEILQAIPDVSYEKAGKGNVSRQTVHNRLIALDDLVQPVTKADKSPETLDIFVDEDHVHLRPKGSAIVPLVTVTEGMDTSNPKRHKTINPFHIAAYGMQMETFRENVVAVINERYDLEKVKQINIHADGGRWILGLQELLPHSRMIMDGYHLQKQLKSITHLEGANSFAGAIHQAMRREDGIDTLISICDKIYQKQTTQKHQDKVTEFVTFCVNHWDSIVARMKGLACGSCTEPLVSHTLSERLSRDPLAWSKDGLNRMTMLIVYTKNGGIVTAKDIRIHPDVESRSSFKEDGYALYRDYAIQQADEFLKEQHDWSIFDHNPTSFGKVDGAFMIRKIFGSIYPFTQLAS